MGPAETIGLVVFSVFVVQGLMKLITILIDKFGKNTVQNNEIVTKDVLDAVNNLQSSFNKKHCGLTEKESEALKVLYDLHNVKDIDGMPIWYVPRSWAVTQKEVVDKLQVITETQSKMLVIIERLERKQEDS